VATIRTRIVLLSEAKYLPDAQSPFAEFILRTQGDNQVKTFARVYEAVAAKPALRAHCKTLRAPR
jgi:hypothetical protein